MKKFIKIISIILLSLVVSSCYTIDSWRKFPVNEKEKIFHLIQEDQIAGFAKVIQNDLSINFLVIGQKNAYLIEEGSQPINELLSSSSENTKLEIITNPSEELILTIKPEQKENYEFQATLAFKITVDQPTQQQIELLKSKSYELNLIEKENKLIFVASIPIKGKILLIQDEMKAKALKNLSKNYKVKVGYYDVKKSFNVGNLLFNIFMTPIALAADATIVSVTAIAFVSGAGIK